MYAFAAYHQHHVANKQHACATHRPIACWSSTAAAPVKATVWATITGIMSCGSCLRARVAGSCTWTGQGQRGRLVWNSAHARRRPRRSAPGFAYGSICHSTLRLPPDVPGSSLALLLRRCDGPTRSSSPRRAASTATRSPMASCPTNRWCESTS